MKRNYLKIISIILFVLFIMEVLLLNQNGLSFRGVYTEKVFFWTSIISGFWGFGIKRYLIAFAFFIFLTMLPMMIPFLLLVKWSISANIYFDQGQGKRIEEVEIFGAYGTQIRLINPYYLLFERTSFKQRTSKVCNQIANLREVENVSIKLIETTTSSKIRTQYIKNKEKFFCEFQIK